MSAKASSTARVADLLAAAPLYAILDTSLTSGLASVLEALLRSGVRLIQYRHKQSFGAKHFEECREMASQVQQQGGLFMVNDRADVASLCGADGVHLGQDDLPPQ